MKKLIAQTTTLSNVWETLDTFKMQKSAIYLLLKQNINH